jgi:hypothetical protein
MFFKDVKVLRNLNLDALYGKAVTLIMPDGEEVTYVGEMVAPSSPSINSWIGVLNRHEGHLSIVFSLGSVHGNAAYKGRSYMIGSLAYGQKFHFSEITTLELHEGEPLSNFQKPSASQPTSK